jgi:hypothetical protein
MQVKKHFSDINVNNSPWRRLSDASTYGASSRIQLSPGIIESIV